MQRTARHTQRLKLFITIFITSALTTFAQTPEKAICAVCRVLEGTNEPEKVVATADYQGQKYYFCAKKCKKLFEQEPASYVLPEFPRPAPNFSVTSLNGETVALENYKGKIVLLDFWATWCKPCVHTMPSLQKLHDQFSTRNFSVLGVAIDEQGEKKVKAFVKKHRLTYPISLDAKTNPAWETYKVKVIPAMFLIDASGQIVQQWTGEPDFKEVEQMVESLISKTKEP